MAFLFDASRMLEEADELRRLVAENESLRKNAERYKKIRESRSLLKLYVYEDKSDPLSGDWHYKPSPEDVDSFADELPPALYEVKESK
jgi:hypothetical protein